MPYIATPKEIRIGVAPEMTDGFASEQDALDYIPAIPFQYNDPYNQGLYDAGLEATYGISPIYDSLIGYWFLLMYVIIMTCEGEDCYDPEDNRA